MGLNTHYLILNTHYLILNTMRSIINKISQAVQVVLLAPIKLPGKALNILKYVAVGLGVIESVLDSEKPEAETNNRERTDTGKGTVGAQYVDENQRSNNKDQGLKMNADGIGEDNEGGER
jgi:hypothetical protein